MRLPWRPAIGTAVVDLLGGQLRAWGGRRRVVPRAASLYHHERAGRPWRSRKRPAASLYAAWQGQGGGQGKPVPMPAAQSARQQRAAAGMTCGGGGFHKIASSVMAPTTTARRLPRAQRPKLTQTLLCCALVVPWHLVVHVDCSGAPLLPTGGVHRLWVRVRALGRRWRFGSCAVRAVPVPVCSAPLACRLARCYIHDM